MYRDSCCHQSGCCYNRGPCDFSALMVAFMCAYQIGPCIAHVWVIVHTDSRGINIVLWRLKINKLPLWQLMHKAFYVLFPWADVRPTCLHLTAGGSSFELLPRFHCTFYEFNITSGLIPYIVLILYRFFIQGEHIGSNSPGISGTVPDFLPLSRIPEGLTICPGSKLDSCSMSRFYTTGDQNEPYHL